MCKLLCDLFAMFFFQLHEATRNPSVRLIETGADRDEGPIECRYAFVGDATDAHILQDAIVV